MFCWGSKGSLTPREPAVSGISCMRPCAPLDETAQGWKADSCSMTACRRGAWISLALAAVSMRGAATASSMRSHGDDGDGGAEMAGSSGPAMGGGSDPGSNQAPTGGGGNGIVDEVARRRRRRRRGNGGFVRPGYGGVVRPGKQPGASGLGLLAHGGALFLDGGAHQVRGGNGGVDGNGSAGGNGGGGLGGGSLSGRLRHADAGNQDTNPSHL